MLPSAKSISVTVAVVLELCRVPAMISSTSGKRATVGATVRLTVAKVMVSGGRNRLMSSKVWLAVLVKALD